MTIKGPSFDDLENIPEISFNSSEAQAAPDDEMNKLVRIIGIEKLNKEAEIEFESLDSMDKKSIKKAHKNKEFVQVTRTAAGVIFRGHEDKKEFAAKLKDLDSIILRDKNTGVTTKVRNIKFISLSDSEYNQRINSAVMARLNEIRALEKGHKEKLQKHYSGDKQYPDLTATVIQSKTVTLKSSKHEKTWSDREREIQKEDQRAYEKKRKLQERAKKLDQLFLQKLRTFRKKDDQKTVNLKKDIKKKEGFSPELPSQKKLKS